jgi:hypothetical protein
VEEETAPAIGGTGPNGLLAREGITIGAERYPPLYQLGITEVIAEESIQAIRLHRLQCNVVDPQLSRKLGLNAEVTKLKKLKKVLYINTISATVPICKSNT